MCKVAFSFYGVGVEVSATEAFCRALTLHFSYFRVSKVSNPITFRVEIKLPDYEQLPPLRASLVTPRNVTYRYNDIVYLDYCGKALMKWFPKQSIYELDSQNQELAIEIVYLCMLAEVSRRLDRIGIHRIHALGLETLGKGILVLLPSGGGKSTLALEMLKTKSDVRMLSEDSPLLSNDRLLLPFPIRFGIDGTDTPPDYPPEHLQFMPRMEFHPKWVISIEAFADRICKESVPAHSILIGVRTTSQRGCIMPISRITLLKQLLTNSVIGIGLFQGLEFMTQRGFGDFLTGCKVLLSRFFINLSLFMRCKVYSFEMGRSSTENARILTSFLEQLKGI